MDMRAYVYRHTRAHTCQYRYRYTRARHPSLECHTHTVTHTHTHTQTTHKSQANYARETRDKVIPPNIQEPAFHTREVTLNEAGVLGLRLDELAIDAFQNAPMRRRLCSGSRSMACSSFHRHLLSSDIDDQSNHHDVWSIGSMCVCGFKMRTQTDVSLFLARELLLHVCVCVCLCVVCAYFCMRDE